MELSKCLELQRQVAALLEELHEKNTQLMHLQASVEKTQKANFLENSNLSGSSSSVYEDLMKRYGHHMNRGAEGLLAFWRQVGGEHGWRNYCLSPEHLSLLLSKDDTPVVHLRVNRELNKNTHGTFIDEADVRPFFCQVLSRLPNLKRVMITDSPVTPFDWNSMKEVSNPFPELRFLMLWSTPASSADLLELSRRATNIISVEEDHKGGIRVNRGFLTDPSEEKVLLEGCNKIRVYD